MADSESTSRKRSTLTIIALAVAALAAAVPVFWFAAMLAVSIVAIAVGGRLRWLIVTVGGVLTVVSCVRFALEHARPNLQAETVEVEKQAISHLREIYWAESQARQYRVVDSDQNGEGEYLSLPELLHEETTRLRERRPLLKPGAFRVVDAERGIYESERYLFIVYLPGADGLPTTKGAKADPEASSRSFAAYAWPVDVERGHHPAYYVDQFEQICVSDQFAGPATPPAPSAYALNAREGVSVCGQDEETPMWRAWKGRSGRTKEPRATR